MIYFKILGIKYLENAYLFFLTEISFVKFFWILHGFLWDRHLNDKHRFTFCRFRTSNHRLQTEVGRWTNVERHNILP